MHFATTDHYLGHEVLFTFANTLTQGLAVKYASRLGVDPVALIVLDIDTARKTGGIAYFCDGWIQLDRKVKRIDLAKLHDQVFAFGPPQASALCSLPERDVIEVEIPRQVQTMLFADV